jgi:MraZ protein
MFQGSFQNTLDGKGRIAIPARFREALGAVEEDRLMVTHFEVAGVPCLEAYAPRAWQQLVESLTEGMGQFSQSRMLFETVYVGGVQTCQPDKQGRVLIPQDLRKRALLEQEVIFLGVGQKFRMFDSSAYERVEQAFHSIVANNPDAFRDLGI